MVASTCRFGLKPGRERAVSMRTAAVENRKKRMQMQPAIVLVGMMIFGVSLLSAAAQESVTTRHNYEKCREAPSPEPDIIEVRQCSGPSGIAVVWMSEPDSSSISFGSNPLDENLEIGAAFEADAAIEWRSGKTGKAPVAAIVRYRTGDSVGKLDKIRIVVHRIELSGRSCIMGIVSGNEASNKARSLIDRSADRFVCGKSKRADQR